MFGWEGMVSGGNHDGINNGARFTTVFR